MNDHKLLRILTLVVIFISIWVIYSMIREYNRWRLSNLAVNNVKNKSGTCEKHTCGAIDPVSDPVYNIKEVIQQSILLEDHLAIKNKYCIDCITKHFLSLIGYCEEALTLAGNTVHKFPYMDQCAPFYERLYKQWSANKKDDKVILEVLTELREMRKKLMSKYLA